LKATVQQRRLRFIRAGREGRLDLDQEVELTHLRLEKTFEGSVSLDRGEGEVQTISTGEGHSTSRSRSTSPRSSRSSTSGSA